MSVPYLRNHLFSLVLYMCKELSLPINQPLSSFFFFFLVFVCPLEPLPVSNVSIYDYKPSPETGVLFEIQYPEKYNVFTRVNISYWEGKDYRTMLYKGRRKLFHQKFDTNSAGNILNSGLRCSFDMYLYNDLCFW